MLLIQMVNPVSLPTQVKTRRLPKLTTTSGLLIFILSGCDNFTPRPVEFTQDDIIQIGDVHTLEIDNQVVSSLPQTPPVIDTNQAALGKLLFWDPILSGDQDVACATCHLPEQGYTDGLQQSIGVGGTGRGADRQPGHTGFVRRNSQGLTNTAWNGIDSAGLFDPENAPMFWDSRVKSLALQALEPIRDRQEMRGDQFTREQIDLEIENRLNQIDEYRTLFAAAFNDNTPTLENAAVALAEFQKTLVANNSDFDRWMRGEPDAMSAEQISAMQEFVLAGCADCHSGPMFSDFELHVLGAAEHGVRDEPDNGDGNFAFRTPTLRQLDFTAPYFHNGQFASLSRAIEFYDERDSSANPNVPSSSLDEELLDIPEMDEGRGDFIENFLRALNDNRFDQTIPESVPSGLPPGGVLQP